MAAFQHDRDYQNLDYRLLREGTINLYLDADILAEDISWLETNNYQVNAFDCSKWNSALEMHQNFFVALDFPKYYGGNLDALNDCINGLEINEEGGRVLVFRRFDIFAAKFPDVAWNILDIIEGQSRFYLLNGKRFIALVQSSDQTIKFAPFGCHSMRLSPRER